MISATMFDEKAAMAVFLSIQVYRSRISIALHLATTRRHYLRAEELLVSPIFLSSMTSIPTMISWLMSMPF